MHGTYPRWLNNQDFVELIEERVFKLLIGYFVFRSQWETPKLPQDRMYSLGVVEFFFLRKSKSTAGQFVPYTIGNKNPKNKKFYDNTITIMRGLRIGFWPILDGVPQFGPPQDPNITIKKIKTF